MSLAALPSVECRCSDLRLSYLQQTVHFFQSDTHTAIPNKLAFTSLHCSISNYTLKGLRSDKPSHKHGPNKYPPGGGDTLGISGWGCAAGTLEPLTYTRASSAEFCYPILP